MLASLKTWDRLRENYLVLGTSFARVQKKGRAELRMMEDYVDKMIWDGYWLVKRGSLKTVMAHFGESRARKE